MRKGFSRRRFVETAGAASIFALAGCTNNGGEDNETPEENNETGGLEDANGSDNATEDNETDNLDTEDSNVTDDPEDENESETEDESENESETEDESENETTETGEQTQTIRLGAEAEGWQGQAPSDIEGETNPAITLQAGMSYDLTWENLDGEEHELIVADAAGNEIEASDESEQEGETVSMVLEVTEEMAGLSGTYYCEYHPEAMRGEISIE